MNTLEVAKKSRKVQRTCITKLIKDLNELLSKGSEDIDQINALGEVLDKRYQTLTDLDSKVYDLMLNDESITEEDLENELKKVNDYSIDYFKVKSLISKLKEDSDASSDSSLHESEASIRSVKASKCSYRLPLLKFKEFSGELKDWLPFWSQFKRIHNHRKMDDAEKLQYLIMATKPDSVAREIVESYPSTAEMYPEVIKALKSRFGRVDLLTEYYIRELVKMIIQNTASSNKLPLSTLYDKLQTHLRNLDSLGVTLKESAATLFPLVSSCLPEEILKVWERSGKSLNRSGESEISSKDILENLMQFLKTEVEGDQKVALAMEGFGINETNPVKSSRKKSGSKTVSEIPTAAGLHVSSVSNNNNNNKVTDSCIFCSFGHKSQECIKAQKMPLEERQKIVESKRVCFCCLKRGHTAKNCRRRPKCMFCDKSHYVLMCTGLAKEKEDKLNSKKSQTPSHSEHVDTLASLSSECDVMMQTLRVIMKGKNNSREVRALIDTGSQRSYILLSTAFEMEYEPCRQATFQHNLFGGATTGVVRHDVFEIYISSLNNSYACKFKALGQQLICNNISPVKNGPWMNELNKKGFILSDYGKPGPIELLIGADVAGKLYTGIVEKLSCGVVAIETRLGWSIMGKTIGKNNDEPSSAMVISSMLTVEAKLSDLWSLDTLGIIDPSEKLNKLEIEAATHQHFVETVSVTQEGRFEVHLPWVESHPALPSNYHLALKRLNSTVRKLKDQGYYDVYQEVFDDWLKEGIIEEVKSQEVVPCHYLPHRHVVKPNSTTPVRPVFDASARENKSPSLNQCLEKGPNLLEKIPTILARFRLKKIGVVADIRRAFLQISLTASDRDYLRFLWTNKNGELKIYRHCRVVFGVSSSPFLLEACIKFHLENVLSCCKEGKLQLPVDLVEKLISSFYVDNCLTSLDNEEQTCDFIDLATSIMAERKFELRGWERSTSLLDAPPTNVLGLLWDRYTDTLEINLDNLESLDLTRITKKVILSAAHRIFDPIGFTCCVTLIPKLLLQQTWASGITWDHEVDESIKVRFLAWFKDLSLLDQIKIPRWLPGKNSLDTSSLHIFSDASGTSYAAVAFLRTEFPDHVEVQLVMAKSRVAPISKTNKGLTIPRLELIAATIAARLYRTIVEDFGYSIEKTVFWTDATTVLAWIKRDEPWDVFVSNRIKEIRNLTSDQEWRHVPGAKNPADLPSRGCTVKKLLESRWWEGPDWLKEPPEKWPHTTIAYDEREINCERKKNVTSSMVTVDGKPNWYYEKFSRYRRIVCLIGWIYRFWKNCMKKKEDRNVSRCLTAEEFTKAETKVLFLVQKDSFSGVLDPKLSSLLPFVDSEGVIRLMTKVSNSADANTFRHPAVLPNHEHPVVRSLILDTHEENAHCGIQTTLAILRKQCWILGGRRTIRSVTNSCKICKRYTAERLEAAPSALPFDRVREAKVFEVVGVDLAGPLYLKSESGGSVKTWICLYTCAVYRAVHLELISSLSTDSFLMSLRRFTSRRGRPSIIYSDQGKNFIGADNAFRKLDWSVITNYSTTRKIEWKFNPPAAPWWGGWWERLIGILKNLLRRVLGRTSVGYEEMTTILCDCEAVINSRPLTYISQDPKDLAPLTPSMFLQDVDEVGTLDLDTIESCDLRKRLRYRHQLKQDLLKRFRSEYLGQLKLLSGAEKSRDIKIGEIVLVGSDVKKRLDWPIARVLQVMPGNDGNVRVVRLMTASGEIVRPIQRVYPLELHLESTEQEESTEELRDHLRNISRSGRYIKKPEKLDL